jgi:serine/threonine-protein kinase
MAPASIADLVTALSHLRLLEPAQAAGLPALQAGCSDPRVLARELVQRGWLTPFRVNQLFLGRGAELCLGPYVLLERLGAGGMGTVFKGDADARRVCPEVRLEE